MMPFTCSSSTVTRSQKRISESLLDRIDIHIEVPRVDFGELSEDRFGELSSNVQTQIEAACKISEPGPTTLEMR